MKPTDPGRRIPPMASTPTPPYRPLGVGKIQPCHLDRLAVVYIRQSTPQQVLEHRESRERQYALANYATTLGWPADRILVIDEDQGRSGRSADTRAGFQHLLAEVTLDHVGIVLGLEMSRLARSSKDCHHLIEVCGIFRTLLGDQDGIYDANDPNDRLLLGLKGTISEVELHTLRSRLERGRLHKAQRGELFHSVPRGYVRGPCGQVEFDPDEQVRAVVQLIFDKFDELGTVHAVFRYLLRHDIRLGGRFRTGPRKGQLQWRRPSLSTLFSVLRHPFYAGIYVHGRRRLDPKRKKPDRPGSGRVVMPPTQWQVRLPGRLPAYISEERYEANQQRLQQNQSRPEQPGTPRAGRCLLSGLLRCGRCGCRMQATYPNAGHLAYVCNRSYRQGTSPSCPGVRGSALDQLVAEQVLLALEPASLQLSLHALADVAKERQRLDRHWQQQRERARYETQEAERRYQLVDPANRLVARTLEQRWEEALRNERQLEEAYDRFVRQQPAELTEVERQRLLALAQDIPMLWRADSTTIAQRKEIARCLVDRVIVAVTEQSEEVAVTIHWAGGFASEHAVRRPVCGYEQLRGYAELKNRIVGLWQAGHSATEIAQTLNAEGWRPPKQRETFNKDMVSQWLSRQGLNRSTVEAARLRRGEWHLKELAVEVGMKSSTLRLWRRRGWVNARRIAALGCWIVWADAEEIRRLRRLVALSKKRPRQSYPEELVRPKHRKGK